MRRNPFVVVSTTVADLKAARALARGVLCNRLAACVHVLPVQSAYWWKGKIENSREFRLEAKTRLALAEPLQRFIRANHAYEVPEIVATPVLQGLPDYLKWIETETAPSSRRPAHATKGRRKSLS